jgi:barstar (barnase inhibitor)
MSGLAALLAGHTKPDVYQWHNAANVDDVAHAVEKAGWRFVYLDGWMVEDKEGFLKALGAALDLPGYDGGSFDGLAEKLHGVDAGGHQGIVFLWDGWSPLARADEEAFQKSLSLLGGRTHDEGCDKCAVLLRGEGPSIDVPELPDGPH